MASLGTRERMKDNERKLSKPDGIKGSRDVHERRKIGVQVLMAIDLYGRNWGTECRCAASYAGLRSGFSRNRVTEPSKQQARSQASLVSSQPSKSFLLCSRFRFLLNSVDS